MTNENSVREAQPANPPGEGTLTDDQMAEVSGGVTYDLLTATRRVHATAAVSSNCNAASPCGYGVGGWVAGR